MEFPSEIDKLRAEVMELRRVNRQSGINSRWLIAQIEKIHAVLCPGETGTWQQRVEQAVKAAERLAPKGGVTCPECGMGDIYTDHTRAYYRDGECPDDHTRRTHMPPLATCLACDHKWEIIEKEEDHA